MAPILGHETKEEQVLKRIVMWKRARARYFIKQNMGDEYWFPLEPHDANTPTTRSLMFPPPVNNTTHSRAWRILMVPSASKTLASTGSPTTSEPTTCARAAQHP